MKDDLNAFDNIGAGINASTDDTSLTIKKWRITKYDTTEDYLNDEPYDVSEFEGNVILNEGISVLQRMLINSGSAPFPYSNASASLGVGNDNTAEVATQTGLLGTHTYATMSAGYPMISGQTTTWRAVFPSAQANFDWREFTISNSGSNAGDNLNRKVSNQGTKASGQTWTLDLDITWS